MRGKLSFLGIRTEYMKKQIPGTYRVKIVEKVPVNEENRTYGARKTAYVPASGLRGHMWEKAEEKSW